jgi:hypothetical protein
MAIDDFILIEINYMFLYFIYKEQILLYMMKVFYNLYKSVNFIIMKINGMEQINNMKGLVAMVKEYLYSNYCHLNISLSNCYPFLLNIFVSFLLLSLSFLLFFLY